MPSKKRNTGSRGYTKEEKELLLAAKKLLADKGIKTTKSRGPAYKERLEFEKEQRRQRPATTCGDNGGLNLRGKPCGSYPLKKGTNIEGVQVSGKYCLLHDPDVPEGAFNRFVQEKGTEALRNRPKQMRPFQLMAMAMTQSPGLFLQPYFEALGLKMDPDTGEVKKVGDGAKIIGFSREGVARVSKHKDLEAQQRAAERLFDRTFGKARQSMELAGGGSGMAMITIPQTEERAQSVAKVLMEAGAVQIELNNGEV